MALDMIGEGSSALARVDPGHEVRLAARAAPPEGSTQELDHFRFACRTLFFERLSEPLLLWPLLGALAQLLTL